MKIQIKQLPFFILFLSIISIHAQVTTKGELAEVKAENANKGIFLIPFQTKMYISDINKEISERTHMNHTQIAEIFRSALDQNLYLSLKEQWQPISLYQLPIEEARKEFSYIYSSIGYKYIDVPLEENTAETKTQQTWKKFKQKVVSAEEEKPQQEPEKYMQTKITNPNLLSTLFSSYNTNYFLFINQLDIKRALGETSQGNPYDNKREMVVHYTIFDKNGNIVKTGVAKSYFNKNVNDIEQIIKQNFPVIASFIANKFSESILNAAQN
jgi:hypothetical protein